MADKRSSDEVLSRFWNALVLSDGEPPLGDLAPQQAETVRWLHAMTRAPLPAEIRERVDRTMDTAPVAMAMEIPANGHTQWHVSGTDVVVLGSGGRAPDRRPPDDKPDQPVRPLSAHRPRWAAFPLATALLLLVTLGLGVIVGSLGRSVVERRTVLPAVTGSTSDEMLQSPEGPAETTLETVFATTLPPEMLPAGGYLSFGFWRLELAPGVSTPVPPEGQRCCRGPQITHVLAGELTVQVDGPLQLFRGSTLGSTGVELAPGTSTVVRPGDTIIYDFASPAVYANHGTIPVQIVDAGFNTGTLSGEHWLTTMDYLDGSQEFSQSPLPAGPLAVSLVRAVLPPNGEVPAPPRGAFVLEVGENGDASIGKRADDGLLFNISDKTETIYVAILEPLGTPMLMP